MLTLFRNHSSSLSRPFFLSFAFSDPFLVSSRSKTKSPEQRSAEKIPSKRHILDRYDATRIRKEKQLPKIKEQLDDGTYINTASSRFSFPQFEYQVEKKDLAKNVHHLRQLQAHLQSEQLTELTTPAPASQPPGATSKCWNRYLSYLEGAKKNSEDASENGPTEPSCYFCYLLLTAIRDGVVDKEVCAELERGSAQWEGWTCNGACRYFKCSKCDMVFQSRALCVCHQARTCSGS